MKDYSYIKVPKAIAKRGNLQDNRLSLGSDFVLVSESDLRMIDMTTEEKIEYFKLEVLTEDQALQLIEANKLQEEEQPLPIEDDSSAGTGNMEGGTNE